MLTHPRRPLVITPLLLLILTGFEARANPLNPNSFASLGALNLAAGMLTINTDTVEISGSTSFTGVLHDQGPFSQNGVDDFNRHVAVFNFSNINIGPSVVITVTGSRPLALLSGGNLTLNGNVNLSGGAGGVPTGGAGGAAGGGAGGEGGVSGLPGVGPGGGSGTGTHYDGGGGGYGGAGGTGGTSSFGGSVYGNPFFLLQGGSGGGGAFFTGSPMQASGGGGGGGALELGAVGLLTLNGNVTVDGGASIPEVLNGGGGSGGGLLLHASGLSLNGSMSAQGGSSGSFGGGGSGGRVGIAAGSLTGSQVQSLLATNVNGGVSGFAGSGQAGILVVFAESTVVQAGETLSLHGITSGQTGRTDPYTEFQTGDLWVQSGGHAIIANTGGFQAGSHLTVDGLLSAGGVVVQASTLSGSGQIQVFGTFMEVGHPSSGNSGSFSGSIVGNGLIVHQGGQLTLGGSASIEPTLGVNNGAVRVVGPDVYLQEVTMSAMGEIRVQAGARLRVGTQFGLTSNQGKFSVLGSSGPGGRAELEFSGHFTNDPSTSAIIMRGDSDLYFTGGAWNFGGIAISFANSNVFGDINNLPGGQISISGNSNVLFDQDITNDGSINVATGSTAVFLGSFNGANGISGGGDIHFAGDLRPGHSPASISFGGNVSLESTARTEVELGGLTPGTEHDKMNVAGHLNLDGVLAVRAIDGFIPLPGQSFEVLTFGSRTGDVSLLNETGFNGLSFTKFFTSDSLSLNAVGTLGDATLDGMVDVRDLLALANNWLGAGDWLGGDFNDDGLVNQIDLTLMAQNWQSGVNAPSFSVEMANLGLSANVPEPAFLGAMALPILLLRRRRR